MRKGVVILGYYGAGNTGDEAILEGMLQSLAERGIRDVTVLSHDPDRTTRDHQLPAIYIGRKTRGLWTIYRTLKKSELFILGGGGLLQDHSARVVRFWLSRVYLAIMAGTPIYYYAQGIGPLYRKKSRFLVKSLSKRAKYITVRDEKSIELLQELGLSKTPLELTADPALLLEKTGAGASLLAREGIELDPAKTNLAIVLRPWKDEAYQANLLATLKDLAAKTNIHYSFVPFQYGMDEDLNRKFAEELGAAANVSTSLLTGEYQPRDLMAILGEYDGVIGMRLHALILGAASNSGVFALSYDDKVTYFMERIGLGQYSYPLNTIANNPEAFRAGLEDWLNKLSELRTATQPLISELRVQAERNAEIARQLIS